MIRLFQLDRLWTEIREDALTSIDHSSSLGYGQKGPDVEAVESWLSKLSGRKHAITVGSGTDALTCILQSLSLPPGARVAVPSYSFIASATGILRAGLVPVFVDCDINYHIDIDSIPTDVDAVILVDLFGLAMDYDKLSEFQRVNPTIKVIMDAAQSIETVHKDQSSMSIGIASSVSFAPTKTIPVFGSGGAVLTDSDALAASIRMWRTHGKVYNKTPASCVGGNSMMSSMEAAQLMACARRHTQWQQRRNDIATQYINSTTNPKLRMPIQRGQHTWHKFVITCNNNQTREQLKEFLYSKGIQTEVYYELLINQEEIFNQYYSPTPIAEQLSKTSLALPCQHTLTDQEVNTIVQALKEFK